MRVGSCETPPPVDADHQGLHVGQVPVEPHQTGGIVGRAVVRNAGKIDGHARGRGELDELRRRVGIHTKARERRRIGRQEGRQGLTSEASLKRREHEQPVGNDGPAEPAADLILGVALAEGRVGHAAPREIAVPQRVRHRSLRHVGPAAGGRGDHASGELPPGHVECAHHHPGRADRVLRHRARPEAHPVEGDVVGGGPLTRHRELRAARVGLADSHHAGDQRRERIQIRCVDGEPGDLLGIEIPVHLARRGRRGPIGRAAPDRDAGDRDRRHAHDHVAHQAVFVGLTREREALGGHADGADQHLVLPPAVREDDGVPPPRVGGALAGDLRLDRGRLDHRAGEGERIGTEHHSGDDVRGGPHLRRRTSRHPRHHTRHHQPPTRPNPHDRLR